MNLASAVWVGRCQLRDWKIKRFLLCLLAKAAFLKFFFIKFKYISLSSTTTNSITQTTSLVSTGQVGSEKNTKNGYQSQLLPPVKVSWVDKHVNAKTLLLAYDNS